ncbi:hypothetical protein [Polaromonas sp.]|uniref:hypothetical protein n=1 Tax=Polaromonas sp. TaxID=1869339 RepID=UPI00352B8198
MRQDWIDSLLRTAELCDGNGHQGDAATLRDMAEKLGQPPATNSLGPIVEPLTVDQSRQGWEIARQLAKLATHTKDCTWASPMPTGGTWGCSCGLATHVLDGELLAEEPGAAGGASSPNATSNPTTPKTALKAPDPVEIEPAKALAWEQVRKAVGAEGWTVSEASTYYGFFSWGWNCMKQIAATGPTSPRAVTLTKPPLTGRWHHGQGYLVSGSIRISRWDCDTNPPIEFRDQMMTWICEALNQAVEAYDHAHQGWDDLFSHNYQGEDGPTSAGA